MAKIRMCSNSVFVCVLCGCFLFIGTGNITLRGEVLGYRSQVQIKTLPEKMEKELIQTVSTLMECFANKNEKCVLNMLVTKCRVMMGTDDYMTKKQVEEEFRTKGIYYAYLFDTELHRKLSANDLKNKNKSWGDDALHFNYSVSDVFKMAKSKNLRMRNVVTILSGPPRIGVAVYFDCDGRKEDKVLKNLDEYSFWMAYIDNKWYLTVLDIRRNF